MHNTIGSGLKGLPGCEEMARLNWLDTSECCERCHSAGEYLGDSLGPCCVTLPDGTNVFLCCAGKKQLLKELGV